MNAIEGKRIKGSCRFAPYYKVQRFDARLCVWRDLKQQHATLASAQASFSGGKCRAMRVTMEGRDVV
jgi:hypothetical protein